MIGNAQVQLLGLKLFVVSSLRFAFWRSMGLTGCSRFLASVHAPRLEMTTKRMILLSIDTGS